MEKEVVIKNKSGLHARPATLLVKFAQKYTQKLAITKGERTVAATSLLGVLSLSISPGTTVRLHVEGENAEQVLGEWVEFLDQLAYEE